MASLKLEASTTEIVVTATRLLAPASPPVIPRGSNALTWVLIWPLEAWRILTPLAPDQAAELNIDMGAVFSRTFKAIEAANAQNVQQCIVLSQELSPWSAEHYFAVARPVPGMPMELLSGDYRTKVFEGPFKEAPSWEQQLRAEVATRGQHAEQVYFFYTTCPKCAKTYSRNYVVGVARIEAAPQAQLAAGTSSR